MATNKIVLETADQFMAGYTPIYKPIVPLFLGNAQSYAEEVGTVSFKRLEAVGDIRAKHITPKDTEIRQVSVKQSSKTFKKYFLGNQYQQSEFQANDDIAGVLAQVVDEFWRHQDEIFLLGEGTQNSGVINNGLFWSGDSNFVLEGSAEVDTEADPLIDLHAKVVASTLDANLVSGRKLLMFYGADILAMVGSLYASSPVAFTDPLSKVLGSSYQIALMPTDVTPANTNGYIIANLDQVKLHYAALPHVRNQGVNEEKMYSWHNLLMGSMMLEVKASGVLIRQPLTIES